jgi:hypothetical protein
MERINKKQIDRQFEILKELTGETKGYHLFIDYASIYGGYRLVNVKEENGAHFGAFGQSSACPRMSAKEFYAYLAGLIEGIKHFKKQ